jgi:hypothetical protein
VASFDSAPEVFVRLAAAVLPAVEVAADEMAGLFRREVRGEMGVGHPLHTQTPRAPGQPPAWISGDLRNTILNEPAIPVGDAAAMSKSGPTVRYARIQELGGPMTAHSEKGMRWQQPPGVWHVSMEHDLPPRPYMLPAHEQLTESGALTMVAAAAFGAAVNLAAGL